MALPYDVARCAGRVATLSKPGAAVTVTLTAGQAECMRCRRREPGAPNRPTPQMSPPEFVGGLCHERIAP